MLSKEETTNFLFFINNNVFSALSSIIFLLQCKIFVDALATIADSAESLIELKVIAKCFFQVTHPSSCRTYHLFELERKMCLISEHELNLASCSLVTSVLKLVQDLSSRLTERLGLSTHHTSVLVRTYLSWLRLWNQYSQAAPCSLISSIHV